MATFTANGSTTGSGYWHLRTTCTYDIYDATRYEFATTLSRYADKADTSGYNAKNDTTYFWVGSSSNEYSAKPTWNHTNSKGQVRTLISGTLYWTRTKVDQTITVYGYNSHPSGTMKGSSATSTTVTVLARDSHHIIYDANGGEGSITDTVKFYSDSGETDYYETLSDGSGFTNSGCELVGWNTQPDGSGTPYSLSEVYTDNGTTDVTLYAQWSSNDSGVRVKAEGTWHKGELSVKINGAWTSGTLYKKVNGNWVQ